MRSLLVLCCQLLIAIQVQAAPSVVEESVLLPVQIGARTEKLETLIVRPAREGRFPLALIVNGSAGKSPADMHADGLAHLAHDFAHRGWLAASIVWPGYGRSTGAFEGKAGTCSAPHVITFLDARAKELGAALDALRTRGDVDSATSLGVGVSIGGVSMLALGARQDRPLTAVINISGGIYHYQEAGIPEANCGPYYQDLASNVATFGRRNVTPTLWLYAENDPFFGPELAQRLVSAYRSTGGVADFAALPAFGENGHTLYKQTANALTQPRIDDFLRRNHLPAMEEAALAPFFAKLPDADRKTIRPYLSAATEKALVMSENTQRVFWHYGARTQESARQLALEACQKTGDRSCQLIAENLQLVDGWEAAVH